MTTTHRSPRWLSGLTAVAASATLLSGCGSDESVATGTARAVATTASASPAATATRSASSSAPVIGADSSTSSSGTALASPPATGATPSEVPTSTAGSNAAPALARPTQISEYGEALMQAWQSGRSATIRDLAAARPAATLADTPALPDMIRTVCDELMCSWSDEQGRRVTMTLDADIVSRGEPHGVTAVRIAR